MTARTRPARTTHTVAFDPIDGRPIQPLTATTAAVADLVAAILDHTRRHLGSSRPVWVVIQPGGRCGYLWSGRQELGGFSIAGGVR
jgi:hypothetical protein